MGVWGWVNWVGWEILKEKLDTGGCWQAGNGDKFWGCGVGLIANKLLWLLLMGA